MSVELVLKVVLVCGDEVGSGCWVFWVCSYKGSMMVILRNILRINVIRIISMSGVCYCILKNRCRVIGFWLFSVKVNKVKKMVVLSSYIRYFKLFFLWWDDCSEQGVGLDWFVWCMGQDFGGFGIYLFMQGFVWFEMGDVFFWNYYVFV